MVVAHTCCAQTPIQVYSAPVADTLWMLNSQPGISRLFGLFCFFLWNLQLCRQSGSLPCLLLVHLNKSALRIPALKLSPWPGHAGQAGLVLVCHGVPGWKRCPFMFLFVWDAPLVIIIYNKWISEYPGPKACYKENWNNDPESNCNASWNMPPSNHLLTSITKHFQAWTPCSFLFSPSVGDHMGFGRNHQVAFYYSESPVKKTDNPLGMLKVFDLTECKKS